MDDEQPLLFSIFFSDATSTPTQGIPTESQQETTSNAGLTGPQIGGIVGGSIAFVVILIIVGLVFLFRNQKNAGKDNQDIVHLFIYLFSFLAK